MNRFCDLVRGVGTVTGHVVGQAVKIGVFKGSNFLESETQQMSEAFGRAVPIVLAEKFSLGLAETILNSTFPVPWDLGKIKPKLRVFQRDKDFIEILHNEDPEAVVKRFEEIGAFETTQIVFITHGFIHDIDVWWLREMKDALLQQENMTVCIVGWGGGANIGIDRYDHAARNIEAVGCWLANYTRQMKRFKEDIRIWGVGHSLGAHLMGFAGKCGKSFDRITGLDPAGPNFEREFICTRLSSSDAPFVDVIHTDGYASPLSIQALTSPTNHYGTLVPLGTVDFYPNFGHSQPGCKFSVIGSHNLGFELFTWSISNPGRWMTNHKLTHIPSYMNIVHEAVAEGEEVEMGFHCKGGEGIYYIDTVKESQFGSFIFP